MEKFITKFLSKPNRQIIFITLPIFAAIAAIAFLTNSRAQCFYPAPSSISSPSQTTSTITLNWSSVPTQSGMTGYMVIRFNGSLNGGGGVRQFAGFSTTFTDSLGLQPSTAYYYEIHTYGTCESVYGPPTPNIVVSTASPAPPPSAPTVSISANPSSITSGNSSTINWSSTNASSCTASGAWSGSKATSGSQSTGALTSSQTYSLSCSGAGGTANGSAGVTVSAAPPPPTPAPTVNFSANPTSVVSGNGSTLTWSTANATTCTASGGWSGSKATSGNQSTGNLTSNQTFNLSCSGGGGTTNRSVSVTVTTPTPPPANPPPPGNPPPANPPPVTNPPPPGPPPPSSTPDTSSPSTPSNFTARNTSGSTVSLQWSASTDNVGIGHYRLERSTDGVNFSLMNGNITVTNYTDTATAFATTYTYKLTAFDTSNNASGPAKTEITTSTFVPNAGPSQAVTITNNDGSVTVSLPDDSFDSPVLCAVEERLDYLPPEVSGMNVVAGPYEVICRTDDGTIVTEFKTSPSITMTEQTSWSKFKDITYYGYTGTDWEQIDNVLRDKKNKTVSFELTQGQKVIAVMGKKKTSSIWPKLIITVTLVPAILIGILWFLNRRRANQEIDDYYRKSHGF